MATAIPLRCRCGKLAGALTDADPHASHRMTCYCKDCQRFGRFLGVDGVLDAAGGTDIIQVAPGAVTLAKGGGELACLRLSDQGMFRWYAACCKTPVGNMLGPRLPFVGLIHACLHPEDVGRTLDEAVGPSRGAMHGDDAIGGCPPHAHPGGSPALVLPVAWKMAGWFLKGKGYPQPFFDGPTGAPRAVPKVLTNTERDALA